MLVPDLVLSYRHEKDTRHAGCGRYGNGIFHCILGAKKMASFRLAQIESVEVSFRFVLRSKTNSSHNDVRLVCQMLRFILYPFPSSLRLVYLRQPCSEFFSWPKDLGVALHDPITYSTRPRLGQG
ncbi:hypothetical protein AVEN_161996-1 [Araneus ventricosus]|uniref:Uncharacterized protein n=1 Tax=Araneus ventricosus TaxID=182803 RepID=A0A4Y2K4M5_ARAVE|nr:hypothetical protein AVEN_161996-1 [Araneus ventricosus]